jgi:hypothetical protein
MAAGHRLSLDLFLLFRAEITPIIPSWVINEFLMQARVKQRYTGVSLKQDALKEAEQIIEGEQCQP